MSIRLRSANGRGRTMAVEDGGKPDTLGAFPGAIVGTGSPDPFGPISPRISPPQARRCGPPDHSCSIDPKRKFPGSLRRAAAVAIAILIASLSYLTINLVAYSGRSVYVQVDRPDISIGSDVPSGGGREPVENSVECHKVARVRSKPPGRDRAGVPCRRAALPVRLGTSRWSG
jgi:hypothetical protein